MKKEKIVMTIIDNTELWDFPGDPVVETLSPGLWGLGSIPGTRSHMQQLRACMPQRTQCSQINKQILKATKQKTLPREYNLGNLKRKRCHLKKKKNKKKCKYVK